MPSPTTLCQTFRLTTPTAASDVIFSGFLTPIVLNKCIKFRDTRFNHSPKIRPAAIGGGISTVFRDNVRPEVLGDVVPGDVAVA